MKSLIVAGLLSVASLGLSAPAEAHTKEKARLVCESGDGCKVVLTSISHTHGHGHHHHHGPRKRTKIKFTGNVCRYKPHRNVTVCRY